MGFPQETSMTTQYQPLSLIPLDQEEYNRRAQRLALSQSLGSPPTTLTPAEIKAYFRDVENRLTNVILLMPGQPPTEELSQKRKALMLDWAFIHNETEKLLVNHPWLSPTPITVLRRLMPEEKKALEELKKRRLTGQVDLLEVEDELRLLTKSLDQSVPSNAEELLGQMEKQVFQLQAMLHNLQTQVIHWPN
jgi:hypothetical protein